MTLINRENATCQLLSEQPYHFTNRNSTCAPDFDKSLCWYNVTFGSEGHRQCPFTFCPSVPGCENIAGDVINLSLESAKILKSYTNNSLIVKQSLAEYYVNRRCHLNGTWGDSVYKGCIDLMKFRPHCIVGYCRTCPDLLRETVINVSLTLSVISVGVLVSALILFSLFDSLQCRRLSIHKNLALAFVFRFAVLAIWTIANTSNAFRDCTHFNPLPLRNWEWLCKGILWLVIYFQVASVMWMLIEGLYLYSRFTVFGMRHNESPYAIYLFSGWVLGIPFIVVFVWTIVHENRSRQNRSSFCWLPYAQGPHLWILAGTMGLALILNVLFLLAIVVILIKKLRTENSAESKKIWKTVKATILLVPLLGISNIPLFYEPTKPSAIYMLGSAILQHSQGIFIAVLYCFLNGEIQNAVKRQLSKASMNWCGFLKTTQYVTERTYISENNTLGKNRNRINSTPISNHRYSNISENFEDNNTKHENEVNHYQPKKYANEDEKNDLKCQNAHCEALLAPKEDLLLVVLDSNGKVDENSNTSSNINNINTANGDSLQRIRASVSQFFNENFERLAKANATPGMTALTNNLNAGLRRPTIAASEKSDSTFSTPSTATPTRRLTTTSLSVNQTPIVISQKIRGDLKTNTKL